MQMLLSAIRVRYRSIEQRIRILHGADAASGPLYRGTITRAAVYLMLTSKLCLDRVLRVHCFGKVRGAQSMPQRCGKRP